MLTKYIEKTFQILKQIHVLWLLVPLNVHLGGGGYSVVQELWVDVFKKISLYQINIDYLIIIPTLKVLEELSGVSVPYFQCVI